MKDHRIELLEERNAALEEKLERAINAGTQISAELERLPASSGPEQTKCKTCKDTKSVYHEDSDRYDKCPDCAKDRAEPKCVCILKTNAAQNPMCGRPYNGHLDGQHCLNRVENKGERFSCGHSRACHAPAGREEPHEIGTGPTASFEQGT